MAKIPHKYKAVDGISGDSPGKALVRYIDWEALKREFLTNPDCPRPQTWLRRVKGWSLNRVRAGNTLEHISGWGNERATFQQRITQRALDDVMAQERALLPQIRKAKLALILEAIKAAGTFRRLEPAEQRTIYQIIKTELGEPIRLTVHGVITPKDPVEALLEEYGLMKDGIIIDDDPDGDTKLIGGTDTGEAAEVASSPHAEVPQG